MSMDESKTAGEIARPRIRVGIGGWVFEPWRNNFYPKGLPIAKELEYASRKLSMIEINGTYYGLQNPTTYAKWGHQAPEGFVFSLKAWRFATQPKVLADAASLVKQFINSGVTELAEKLGPIVWQFLPTKKFEPGDFEAFLKMLPAEHNDVPLRHALEVRHKSFQCAEYLEMARHYGMGTVFTDSDDYPSFADVTGPFVYVRTMRTDSSLPLGCTPEAIAQIAASARRWHEGDEPEHLPRVQEKPATPAAPRDVYLLFISGAKEKAPHAAMAVIEQLA